MGLDDIDEKIYEGDPHEMVGRFVTNAFGVKENVIMPKLILGLSRLACVDWGRSDEIVKTCDDEHPSHDPTG